MTIAKKASEDDSKDSKPSMAIEHATTSYEPQSPVLPSSSADNAPLSTGISFHFSDAESKIHIIPNTPSAPLVTVMTAAETPSSPKKRYDENLLYPTRMAAPQYTCSACAGAIPRNTEFFLVESKSLKGTKTAYHAQHFACFQCASSLQGIDTFFCHGPFLYCSETCLQRGLEFEKFCAEEYSDHQNDSQ